MSQKKRRKARGFLRANRGNGFGEHPSASCAALTVAIVSNLLLAAADFYIPLLQSEVVDQFIRRDDHGLRRLAQRTDTVVCALKSSRCSSISRRAWGWRCYTGRDMKDACFVNLQRLSLDYYNVTSAGHTLSRVDDATPTASRPVMAWIFPDILWGFAYILGVLGVMLSLSAALAMTIIVDCADRYRADGLFPEKAHRAQPRCARSALENHQQLQRGHHGREDQQNPCAGRPPDR